MYILSKTFETSNQAIFAGNPPTKDMIELFQKQFNKANSKSFRIDCLRAVCRVLKAQTSNVSLVANDLVDFILKTIKKVTKSDVKASELKYHAKVLTLLVRKHFSFLML